ncbi:LOW QUALITY PROTEIN: adenomatous polyposis coli protein [Drosophila obscura]|uniref:LOW QUALITY PROTEIN: adenomatous polyposis coli protein n=1 Tax=Drosophila obscura TaxID=7282 RepID=UPI001BB24897|nr:LOW QUALITY PROTEIN: adenomatous polyposis coli protein [Drosophila obscura]
MTLNESDTRLELTRNFLELSRNVETCTDLRSSDCIQILVQILHANDEGLATARKYASQALHNIVHSNPEEKERQREVKMLRLLDQILDYCNFLRTQLQSGGEAIADDEDRHPLAAMKLLMKASFDEEHRMTMCELGALKAIPNLVHLDHAVHGPAAGREQCNAVRSYGLMALTNLTFGDENVHNKSYLCGQRQFMEVVIAQLNTAPDDLLQVLAGVLRNLSWRADKHMKTIFNELGTVTALARAAMQNKSENTLKAVLSALWNLSAHCSTNKAEFCAVDGALAFLVSMLSYEGPSKTLKIIENAGGILRNVSSHIAVCESYREILRRHDGLSILLQQLKSESLTVVSNSCGTLWNLSARCPEDQQFLIDHNAIPLLRALIASKNSMIAEGSASALKNLVNFRAALELIPNGDSLSLENDAGHAGTLPRRYTSLRLSSNPTGSLKKVRPATVGKAEFLTRKCGGSRESIYSGKSDSTKYSSKSEGGSKNPFEIVTPTEEQPIDYSMKYMEHKPDTKTFEIDLDQPTDFSARYKERRSITTASTAEPQLKAEASEIISDALPLAKSESASALVPVSIAKPKIGTETGEQPINYCEEGTPGSFSRFDSLNSLTEKTGKSTDPMTPKTPTKPPQPPPGALALHSNTPQNIDSALETPLMFSRRSSMDSLVGGDDETIACEDNGSVISEYSRMQSGVISPSELPDSPTQSMPQSPRRDRKMSNLPNGQNQNDATTTTTPRNAQDNVFEDKLNRFHLEHTPAVFSCATSLSNLSILDDSNANGNGNRETHGNDINGNGDDPRSYCTEDTPALLSKAPSNSELSTLSIPNDLNANEERLPPPRVPVLAAATTEDAIAKMRCGGSSLPSYLPVSDEMSKYYVEDSPCTFSVISGLSHLTVGSTRAGPVSQLPVHLSEEAPKLPPRRNATSHVEVEPRLPPKRSDSLSSLSMDSDDDCNLLSQAIAAGSCRPQPSGASASTSSSHANTSTSTLSKTNGQRKQTMDDGSKLNYSSDDSLDDDDGQSKSLFEQCILSGMHKSNDALESESEPASSGQGQGQEQEQEGSARDRFVSNQVRQIESMLAGGRPHPPTASSRQQEHRV